jgi:hypothetical protein
MKIEEELGMIPLNSKGTKTGNVNYAFWVYFKKNIMNFGEHMHAWFYYLISWKMGPFCPPCW